jgi:ECF transporter S component (folate family)
MKIKLEKLVFSAMMTALSVVVALVCKSYFTFGAIRITFENLPVILSGVILGPVYGAVVGVASDLISAPLSGFGINPVITLGAASVGFVGGLVFKCLPKGAKFVSSLASVMSAHIVGSMIVKSLGLLMYAYPLQMILLRIPLYSAIGLAEGYLVYCILKNKAISKFSEEVKK